MNINYHRKDMNMGRVLLKLGGEKHLGEQRWQGALNVFDKVYCGSFYLENLEKDWHIEDNRIIVFRFPQSKINHVLHGVLWETKNHKSLNWLSCIVLHMMRLFNHGWISKIESIHPDAVLCSYGDYDFSNLISILTRKSVKEPIVKSYKESRVDYNYLEYKSFKICDIISLYDQEMKLFLERKYSENLFEGKKVILGYDENALPSCILNGIHYKDKLSTVDGKTHVAILTFRVDSEPSRERDQNRYYYIDLIEKLIEAGVVVHLHCAKFIDDSNGINRYKQLEERNPEMFYLEAPLEMKHTSSTEAWINACEKLSKYDAGVMHNIVEGSSVSEFDKINVPHRLFAYEAAHVTPIVKRGENIVLERLFKEKNCGFIYEELSDLKKIKDIAFDYYTPSYEDYLIKLFGGKE